MEAKDTVMNRDYMKTLILAKHCSPETRPNDITITDIEEDLSNEQAEISFKAGQEDEYKKWVNAFKSAGIMIASTEMVSVAIEETKRAGIKKVVELALQAITEGYETKERTLE